MKKERSEKRKENNVNSELRVSSNQSARQDGAAKAPHLARASNFENTIDDLLMYMECRPASGKRVSRPMNFYSGAVPMLRQLAEDYDENFIIPTDAKLRDLRHPDICTASTLVDDYDKSKNLGFTFHRIRRPSAKAMRGKIHSKWLSRDLVEVSIAMVDWKISQFESYEMGVFADLRNGWERVGPWTCSGGPRERFRDSTGSVADIALSRQIQLKLGIAFTLESFWTVDLSLDAGPSVRIPTDPSGAAELFKLRDVPPGKKRRAALRNWVREHYRQNRKDMGHHRVVRHLRGAETFNWNGLRCRIAPSSDDLRLLEAPASCEARL